MQGQPPPPPFYVPPWYPTGPQPRQGAPGAGIKTGRHGRILGTILWWCKHLNRSLFSLFNESLSGGNSCPAKASCSSLPASLRRGKQI